MHFPGSKKRCFCSANKQKYINIFAYLLRFEWKNEKMKNENENRVPSILGLRLKVTVILLIYWKLQKKKIFTIFTIYKIHFWGIKNECF